MVSNGSDEVPPPEITPPANGANGHHPFEPEPERSFDRPHRPICNNSLLSAILVLRKDPKGVLRGRKPRRNLMTGAIELGNRPIRDDDVTEIAARIEMFYVGSVNAKTGVEYGLKISKTLVFDAIDVIATENAYHPVQDYLRALEWDGVARLDAVCEDILGAERTELNQTLIRRWFISAAARALQPGCKVDTALILVGKQGAGKSTFFREISAPWYVETNIDLQNKDSFQILQRAWVAEWAELETMRKARDVAAVKAFLSTLWDVYRPPYGKYVQEVPRGCVIVGTTNNDEFLTDDTGNRRFWPMVVGSTNLSLIAHQRDQLWAEAVHLYQAQEPWWLSEAEAAPLAAVHHDHETSDPWIDRVLDFAQSRVVEFRTADVLAAITDDASRWGRGEEMRVASILKRAGWRLGKKPAGRARPWLPPHQQAAATA